MPPQASVRTHIAQRPQGAVATITLDNAAKLNTLDRDLMTALTQATTDLAARDGLRALVLTGAGDRAFIGGANIHQMAALDRAGAEEFITTLHRFCASLRALPVPVIARINGYALGAGLEIAAACDLRIASANAVFGMPEVKVGIPSVIEAALLPRLIGWGRARDLVLCGETIDAAEALRWGLVNRVAEPDALDAAVEAKLASLLAAGPRAVGLQKMLMREWEELPLGQAIEAGIRTFVDAYATDEPQRMMRAFIERKR